jgi:gamma-glutamyltranspeptidase/glutathione hydrolase
MVAQGLGFLLNNEMGDFNPVPGETNKKGRIGTKANLIAPEKRMLSSQSPTIVLRDGKLVMLVGSPGGRTIINTVLQVLLNVIDHGMNIGQAVEAGRIHHQWFPDHTSIEHFAISKDTQRLFELKGHRVKWRSFQGNAQCLLIEHSKEGRIISAGSDTRSDEGGSAGY